VALTESRELQVAIIAAWLRACAVFLIAAHVATRTLREIDDKVLEQMLALPLGRPSLYLGRLAGLAACGALLAAGLRRAARCLGAARGGGAVGPVARLRGSRWWRRRPCSSP